MKEGGLLIIAPLPREKEAKLSSEESTLADQPSMHPERL
mgnify:CR=1 FL=1